MKLLDESTKLHKLRTYNLFDTIAEEVGLSVEKVKNVIKITKEPISLEAPIGSEEDGRFGDFIEDKTSVSPADAILKDDLREQIETVLDQLNEREKAVIKLKSVKS